MHKVQIINCFSKNDRQNRINPQSHLTQITLNVDYYILAILKHQYCIQHKQNCYTIYLIKLTYFPPCKSPIICNKTFFLWLKYLKIKGHLPSWQQHPLYSSSYHGPSSSCSSFPYAVYASVVSFHRDRGGRVCVQVRISWQSLMCHRSGQSQLIYHHQSLYGNQIQILHQV